MESLIKCFLSKKCGFVRWLLNQRFLRMPGIRRPSLCQFDASIKLPAGLPAHEHKGRERQQAEQAKAALAGRLVFLSCDDSFVKR